MLDIWNDLTLPNILATAVVALAVAQILSVLLTFGREKELGRLRDFMNQQRIHNARVSAWINAQPHRMKVEYETPKENMTRAQLLQKFAPKEEPAPPPPTGSVPKFELPPRPPKQPDIKVAEALAEINKPMPTMRIASTVVTEPPIVTPPPPPPVLEKPAAMETIELTAEPPNNKTWREMFPGGLPETLVFKE